MDLKLYIAKGLKILLNPPALRNCTIDRNAKVCAKSELTDVMIGEYSYVGNGCFIVETEIGKFCSIADHVSIGGATHPTHRVSTSPVFHDGKNVLKKNFAHLPRIETRRTVIGNDVWIGMGCLIKAGVHINNGAVIGMGSVVTHDVPAYEIWVGNPARKIKDRYEKDIGQKINVLEWWNWEESQIEEFAEYFDAPMKLIEKIEESKTENQKEGNI